MRYLSAQFAPQVGGNHRLQLCAPRSRRRSTRRSRRRKVSIRARKSAKSIVRKQRGSAATSSLRHMALPSFQQLKGRVLKSFTVSAWYFPEVWTYWSPSPFDYYALPGDDSYHLQEIPRTQFLSHPQINLAISKQAAKATELSLVAACTEKQFTRDIVVTADDWSHGVFQAFCFLPEKQSGRILYENCVGIKYQITSSTPFRIVQVSPSPMGGAESILHSVAEMFVLFLNKEFSNGHTLPT